MEIYKKQSIAEAFKVYFDQRMIKILLLGAISGFPWVIIGSALSLWLKDYELSRSTIGWAGLIFSVYAINFIWAPIIDRVKIPFLTQIAISRLLSALFMSNLKSKEDIFSSLSFRPLSLDTRRRNCPLWINRH